MKEIDENNLEAWFLDYFEGQLNEEDKKILWDYLKKHPRIYSRFERDSLLMRDLSNTNLFQTPNMFSLHKDYRNDTPSRRYIFFEPSSSKYSKSPSIARNQFKNKIYDLLYLKNNAEWENQCIAYLEGDLNSEKLKEFEDMLKVFPRLSKDLELFRKAVFKPEPIEFPNKASLYRKNVSLIYRIGLVAAVAALALLVLFYPNKVNHTVSKHSGNGGITTNIHTVPKPVERSHSVTPSPPQPSVATGNTLKTNPAAREVTTARQPESLPLLPSISSVVMIEHSITPPEIQPINRVYTAIYADMMERWQAEAHRGNRSIVSTLLKTVKGLLGKAEETLPGHNPVSIWTLAEFTIKGFNTLTNNDLELKTLKDEQGRIRALAFGNENFRIAHLSKQRETTDSEEPKDTSPENDSNYINH